MASYEMPVIRALPLSLTADVEPAVAAHPSLRLMGFLATESAGSAAVMFFRVLNGATVTGGARVANMQLAADGSDSRWFGPDGVPCPAGITLDHVAGAAEVVLYYRLDDGKA